MIGLTDVEVQALLLSIQVSVLATIASMPLAMAMAWVLARKEFVGKTLLDSIVHLPLVLPPVAVGYLLLVGFGRNGFIGGWLNETFGIVISFTWYGAAVAAAVMSFPLMVRAIRLSIEAIDPKLEKAARTLGAGKVYTFRSITLPLMAPGLIAGTVLGFARALGEFGATITFVGNIQGVTQTLPTALYTAHQMPGAEDAAFRLAIIAVVIAIAALVASEILARRVRRTIYGSTS